MNRSKRSGGTSVAVWCKIKRLASFNPVGNAMRAESVWAREGWRMSFLFSFSLFQDLELIEYILDNVVSQWSSSAASRLDRAIHHLWLVLLLGAHMHVRHTYTHTHNSKSSITT